MIALARITRQRWPKVRLHGTLSARLNKDADYNDGSIFNVWIVSVFDR